MNTRSATAIALVLGLAACSGTATSDTTKATSDITGPQSPGVGQLPGNVGGEGAAGGFAREQNLIDKRDHSDTGSTELTKDKDRLPGNVATEGSGGAVGVAPKSGYNESVGATGGTPVEKRLPGNVGGESSGKTK